METYSEYLMHHGIQGMKWGRRNGPPYPLSASKRASVEGKKGDKTKKIESDSDKSGGGGGGSSEQKKKTDAQLTEQYVDYLIEKYGQWSDKNRANFNILRVADEIAQLLYKEEGRWEGAAKLADDIVYEWRHTKKD